MIDLRQISHVAPTSDLTAGVFLMVCSAVFGLGLVSTRIFLRSPRAALLTVILSVLAMLGAYVGSVSHPAKIHLAALAYAAVFACIGHVASLHLPDRGAVRRALALGVAMMLLAIVVAWWLAFAPR